MSQSEPAVLVINCGSSSLKLALYPCQPDGLKAPLLSGFVDVLLPAKGSKLSLHNDALAEETTVPIGADVFQFVLEKLSVAIDQHFPKIRIIAAAHRIVHGGERYTKSIILTEVAMQYLERLSSLAPLHQENNLNGVRKLQKLFPSLVQVGCFDTGFHADMPTLEKIVPLPHALRDQGIRRYGFHGLSYRYVISCLARYSTRADHRVLIAHLGSGASLCALKNRKSIATSMGFSALDGLMMGSRSGAIDPGILLYLLKQGYTTQQLETALYKEAGLLGVSGISADMRVLRASKSRSATLAIELFTYRLVRECGALIACMGGIDIIVFTGGIGENDSILRRQCCAALAFLGVKIDQSHNDSISNKTALAIHAKTSRVEVWVIPSDEGSIAAYDAAILILGTDANAEADRTA